MNMLVAAIPGLAIGTTMRSSVRHSPQPSTFAESMYSCGMVRKNWRSRKMLKASPRRFGRMSGHSVPVRCSLLHMM